MLDEEVAGKLTKSYQYSPWGERLSQVKHNTDGDEEDGYYGYNPHTDVETLTDKTGDTKATYGYTAYGNNDDSEFTGIDKPDTGEPDQGDYNPYRFNAKRWDAELRHLRHGLPRLQPGPEPLHHPGHVQRRPGRHGPRHRPVHRQPVRLHRRQPHHRIEIDGHDSWFTDVLEKAEETVAKAATAAVESQASRSIWDTAKTAGKRNLVGGAISTVIDIWNGDDPLHALACSAGCRQMNTRSLTDRIRCSSQPREERYMYFPLMNGNATGATALMCPSDLKPPNSRSTEDVFTPQGFPVGEQDAKGKSPLQSVSHHRRQIQRGKHSGKHLHGLPALQCERNEDV